MTDSEIKAVLVAEIGHIEGFIDQNPDTNTAVLDGVVARLMLAASLLQAGEEQVMLKNGMVVQKKEIDSGPQ